MNNESPPGAVVPAGREGEAPRLPDWNEGSCGDCGGRSGAGHGGVDAGHQSGAGGAAPEERWVRVVAELSGERAWAWRATPGRLSLSPLSGPAAAAFNGLPNGGGAGDSHQEPRPRPEAPESTRAAASPAGEAGASPPVRRVRGEAGGGRPGHQHQGRPRGPRCRSSSPGSSRDWRPTRARALRLGDAIATGERHRPAPNHPRPGRAGAEARGAEVLLEEVSRAGGRAALGWAGRRSLFCHPAHFAGPSSHSETSPSPLLAASFPNPVAGSFGMEKLMLPAGKVGLPPKCGLQSP